MNNEEATGDGKVESEEKACNVFIFTSHSQFFVVVPAVVVVAVQLNSYVHLIR
jgi:hypothetical protein